MYLYFSKPHKKLLTATRLVQDYRTLSHIDDDKRSPNKRQPTIADAGWLQVFPSPAIVHGSVPVPPSRAPKRGTILSGAPRGWTFQRIKIGRERWVLPSLRGTAIESAPGTSDPMAAGPL